MSYEGYVQYLCAHGHLRERDCWGEDLDPPLCSFCGADFVFRHAVDQTNGTIDDDPSTLQYPFEVATAAVTEVCNLGRVHVISEATFKIPESPVEGSRRPEPAEEGLMTCDCGEKACGVVGTRWVCLNCF